MMQNRVIRFTKIRFWLIAMSTVLILSGIIVTIARGGFNYGIEFQAGISLEAQVAPDKATVDISKVKNALTGIKENIAIQQIGAASEQLFDIKIQEPRGGEANFSQTMSDTVQNDLSKAFGTDAIKILSNNYVGPAFSSDLTRQILVMVILTLALILVYLTFRFRLGYAMGAIVATCHDVLIMIGFIGAFQIEISTAIVAAVLTIIGYSLNDTIVVFDRIRENEKLMRDASFIDIIDTSITKSLSRTIVTSSTVMMASIALYVFTTGEIKDFALALIIGVFFGTYSSIFIASPVLLGWVRMQSRRRKRVEREKFGKVVSASAPRSREAVPAGTTPESPEAEKDGVPIPDKEAIIREIAQRRASSGGPRKSRDQRKKKK